METNPKWQYDEMKQCGVDYSDTAQVDVYNMRHQRFRDYQKETQEIILKLGLDSNDIVIDMGCGTGAFTLNAAKSLKKIHAVDVSTDMLDYIKQKAGQAGINNIEFHHGGFLTYQHNAEPIDAIISVAVLHHLPDFWKQVALRRMAQMLRPGGGLYLFDVVFSFEIDEYDSRLEQWVKSTGEKVGPEFIEEIETHIRDEYSTFDWIMEELLEKAGFKIEKADYKEGFFATYLCKKKAECS